MTSKHFLHDPVVLVADALQSLPLTNPSVALDSDNKIIYRLHTQSTTPIVSIVSGGGSGHEPSFSAFVGRGLLSASVAGSIFASPSSAQILAAIEGKVDTRCGILVIVMNYTGDVLNFGVAVEKAMARNPGLEIEMLVVGDDVGVPRSKGGKVGRRGIAGTVLVHKITGALAEMGYSLQDVVKVGGLVSHNIVSIGVSLDRVHVPRNSVSDSGELSNTLEKGEVELGMGIHNEAGCGRKVGKEAELAELVKEMLRQLLSQDDEERSFVQFTSKKMVLLVNNLGGLSVLELGAITTEIVGQLGRHYDVKITRTYVGTFMTSLNGLGFSISLLHVLETHLDIGMIELLDAPCEAAGWSAVVKRETWDARTELKNEVTTKTSRVAPAGLIDVDCDMAGILRGLTSGLNSVIASEPEVTRYDEIVGDGDCGTTLKRGAEGILASLEEERPQDILSLLSTVTSAVETTMDGTSGALYSIFLNALTKSLRAQLTQHPKLDLSVWTDALVSARDALAKYTPAKVGDRTLVDALHPFIDTLDSAKSLPKAAADAALGAEKTKNMQASLGRTVYVGGEHEWVGKIPDPGAWGLSAFFVGLARSE